MSQEIHDHLAALEHFMAQMERRASNWQAQAEQHEATLQALRTQRDELLLSLSAANREVGVLTGERDELQRQVDERARNNANLQEEIAEQREALGRIVSSPDDRR